MKELKVALQAGMAASKLIRSYWGKDFKVRKKGEINLVTEVDEKAQATIVRMIQKAFPKDAILAEEGDLAKTKTAERRWIIDPLDGTTNFAHSYPCFCVSIAFEENGVIKVGVIVDPTRKEVFHAVRGRGAFLNKKRIKVSNRKVLRESLLVTGFPYDWTNPAFDNRPLFLHFLLKAQAVRRDGAAALDLAYVACGRFDGFWELGLSPWDVAAGWLLITEAGGEVRHLSGRPYQITDHALIAAPTELIDQIQSECSAASSNSGR